MSLCRLFQKGVPYAVILTKKTLDDGIVHLKDPDSLSEVSINVIIAIAHLVCLSVKLQVHTTYISKHQKYFISAFSEMMCTVTILLPKMFPTCDTLLQIIQDTRELEAHAIYRLECSHLTR